MRRSPCNPWCRPRSSAKGEMFENACFCLGPGVGGGALLLAGEAAREASGAAVEIARDGRGHGVVSIRGSEEQVRQARGIVVERTREATAGI